MKSKRRRAVEVPPKIRAFINNVIATPLENIQEPLRSFLWKYDKGDFHHWIDLFNHFDTFFEKHIKSRKDLQLETDFFGSDPPFPKEAVLQILRVVRIILENCTNKHLYRSYEQHLSSLLASTDSDVLEACLQTLAAFLKKTIAKYAIRDASLNPKLFSLAQGWGGKEEGLGMIACALDNEVDTVAEELGCTLHFEFYAVDESSSEPNAEKQPLEGLQQVQGLQIIHLSNIHSRLESDLEILRNLVVEYKVPASLRFSLLTRLRFARAFGSKAARQQYTCIRLYAFVVLVQACGNTDDLVSFFNSEPEFINELVTLLSYEDAVPEKIRILSLLSLVAVSQDRSRQSTVLTAVTTGGHRGILSSLLQKAIDSVISNSTKWSVVFAEALLSLVALLVSSSSGCSAMREAGFIPTLLPLLKDMDPQHLHLVSMAVHILEAFMDYSNLAASLFRDLGGLDDTISRLNVEVTQVENGSKLQSSSVDLDSSEGSGPQVVTSASTELDNIQPLYSEALVLYHRKLLMKALLSAISLGTYAPGTTARIYGSEESLLPHCLCVIFRRAKDFGGGVFSLAVTVMSDLIHKDPTCFSVLEAANLPSSFIDAIMDGVPCSTEAVNCIPQCLDALCLNNSGLQAVKDRNALKCFVKIFTSKMYLRALSGDIPGSLSSGLDELMRHASSLRGPGVDVVIEIINTIVKLGSVPENAGTDSPGCSGSVPMETDNGVSSDDKDPCKTESSDQCTEPSSDDSSLNVGPFLHDFVSNAARLLETILGNSETCRLFVEKKGIEAVMELFNLPLMPVSVSVGQCISFAFKNFSPQHAAPLVRSVCSFLREHLKSTNELLLSLGGSQVAQLESSSRTRVLRCLSSLEGILSLCNSLLKGTTTVASELGTADADILKDIGKTYKEIHWQISLCCDSKVDEKQNHEVEPETEEATLAQISGRESDDDASIPSIRYMNPVSLGSSHSRWSIEREFLSVVRSSEGFTRRNRHSLARLRGGRASRHLEAFQFDSDVAGNSGVPSPRDSKKKSPDVLALEILEKLSATLRSFFLSLVKGFTPPNRRRTENGSLSSASKNIASALAKVFLEALGFSGYCSAGHDIPLSVKCRYLGKVVDDMTTLTFDARRHTCYSAMVNNFYVSGTFKELLTTFEATSQLLWSLPYSVASGTSDHGKNDDVGKLSHSSWLLDTLQSYCRLLQYFVNSGFLLSSSSGSQSQLLVQPIAVGLSIGLFPVPRDPEVFVRMLQSQVLDVVLPVWNHSMFPHCNAGFVSNIVSLITHVYCGVEDVKHNNNGSLGSTNQRFMPPPDEATIATIVEMGFSRARAVEALRRVETNNVEIAMEWLFSHPEDPVQEDDELARALALSLGSSSEISKTESTEKPIDILTDEGQTKTPPVDEILASTMKLFQSNDSMAFPLTDLFVALCSRNKGEDRAKVITYLVQQLKHCPPEFSRDTSSLCMISHTLALLLSVEGNAREIAEENGVIPIVIDILNKYKTGTQSKDDLLAIKSISSLLLILDSMVQCRPRISSDGMQRILTGSLPELSEEHPSSPATEAAIEDNAVEATKDKGPGSAFEKIFGKATGYLTIEQSCNVLVIACELIKQHVPSIVMQAALQLCSRLTKTHVLAVQFLENGGMVSLFGIPRNCFFPGYDTLVSAIIRHLLEDPVTLQAAMEVEIRQTLSGSRHAGRISVRSFLTSMAPLMFRDPEVFMKATSAVCQLETSGGRSIVVLSKEKDKEKEKTKASGPELGVATDEGVRISESKTHDGSGRFSKAHKKIPVNFIQVIDYLLEILVTYPSDGVEEESAGCLTAMEVDEPTTMVKGKSKVGETKNDESGGSSEKSARLAKLTFVLKLLSDILLMYSYAVGVILRRDLERCQLRFSGESDCSGHGGIIHHVLHRLLPLSVDKTSGPDEWRDKLSEKASWFLVVLSGRSGEGRKRVVTELAKALSSFANIEKNMSSSRVLPDKRVLTFVELVYSILSKNSTSNIAGSGCSPEVAKTMIDGGIVQCLSSILRVIDLDHPDAPRVVNPMLKTLEGLTRAANANEEVFKSETLNKKKSDVPAVMLNDQSSTALGSEAAGPSENRINEMGANDAPGGEPQQQETSQDAGHNADRDPYMEEEMRIEMAPTASTGMELGMDYMREDVERGVLHERDQVEMSQMTFHVENRVDDDMGDEDDEMGDDGEDDEDDDDGDDEDEDIAEEGAGMMSLADTDAEDHDDGGIGDEYNDDMIDEDDDDFHENRVIEVRWREALDGLDHLQVLGRPGTGGGLIDIASDPFEGVTVDVHGLRRHFGFERRRQPSRGSIEQSNTEGTVLQHPLLVRPPRTGDSVSLWSSGNSSRDLEALSAGDLDVARSTRYNSHDLFSTSSNLFGDRLGSAVPPPLADFSIGLESLRVPGRRGLGDGRWTDDGQPLSSGQATAIAQALEDHFVSQLNSDIPADNPAERLSQNSGLLERQQVDPALKSDTLHAVQGDISGVQQNGSQHNENSQANIRSTEVQLGQDELSPEDVAGQAHEFPQADGPASESAANDSPTGNGSMEIQEGSENAAELLEERHRSVDLPMCNQGGIAQGSSSIIELNSDTSLENAGHEGILVTGGQSNIYELPNVGAETHGDAHHASSVEADMTGEETERDQPNQDMPSENVDGPSSEQTADTSLNNETSIPNGIDPTFLDALPEDLRAEVLNSRQAQRAQPRSYTPPTAEDIDPEFLAALPPEIQAEVLAQQRAQRIAQQAEGQPVEMDNASIIATFPADLREEVLLTSSEAVLSALPSPLLAEAQMLRDRAMSHYQARSLFGSSHRLSSRRNALGFERQTVIDRGVGFTGRRASSHSENLKELEGKPLLDYNALQALIRLLRLAQPLGKGLLQRLLLNLCAHGGTRATLVHLLLANIKNETGCPVGGLTTINSQRLYGCQSSVVHSRSQLVDGTPPLVLRRILETLTYLATNHSSVAGLLFYFDPALVPEGLTAKISGSKKDKGKEKIMEGAEFMNPLESFQKGDIPLVLFLRLLSQPLFLRSIAHLEQVMGLLQVVVYAAASKIDRETLSRKAVTPSENLSGNGDASNIHVDPPSDGESTKDDDSNLKLDSGRSLKTHDIFLLLPQSDLYNLCNLLGHEGLSDKVYMLSGEVLKKLASVAAVHRKFFVTQLSDLAVRLSSSAINELITLKNTHMMGLSAGSMAGSALLRVLQTFSSLSSTSITDSSNNPVVDEQEEHSTVWNLNSELDPLWEELSECISTMENELNQSSYSSSMSNVNIPEQMQAASSSSPPLPPGTQRLLPFIEAFFVLCEKLQSNNSALHQDISITGMNESKGSSVPLPVPCGIDSHRKVDGAVSFSRFAEKHRRLLNAFIRQNPSLLEKSLSMMLKASRLVDFDNKKAYFRSRIRNQHEQNLSGPLRISVRRAYILEDSYNQLRMRPYQDLKGRLNVHFQGEEGIDAGGLTREWYQLLSRVVFDKGALLFTTVGNNSTFQPNPNSVYQTEHLSYFKFVGRVVAKALFDGQLLDVYFTRSFYKHILGVKVTYHDIEAVDPDYYKNLKWMLENDVSDIPDLTFSMDADEEKHILYEKTEVMDYELKPGGRNIRVTEETKHEYVDLVADHILTNAIRPQITSFLEGFNELVPRELISIFNDKELELLISGLPEIDFDDLKSNTEYSGYTAASSVVQWFWEVVKSFSKEDMARLLQFVTGTSKIPLEGFKALQGISGPQRFQIHRAYGAPERLPTAHTCFNQLDLPEYTSKEQLQERLLLAIHEASEGFGFG